MSTLPLAVAILLGVTTGIGGGIPLDVVRGDKPIIFGRLAVGSAGDAYRHLPVRRPGVCIARSSAGWIGGVTLVVLRMKRGAKWHWSDPTVHQVSLPDQRSSLAA